MLTLERTDHRTRSQRVYNEALKVAMSDRVMLPDHLLTSDSRIQDMPRGIRAVYDSYYWAAHSLKARAWLQAVIVFNIMLIGFDAFLDPSLILPSLVIRGAIVTAILLALWILWGRERGHAIQGASLIVVSATIVTEAGILGFAGGEPLFERYLNGGLFTVATAILFFPIAFVWTMAAVTLAMVLYVVMLAIGPVTEPLIAVFTGCFYCSAMVTFASTRKAALRSHWKSFKSKVRELRDQETLEQLNSELRLAASLDPLTGALNRRAAQEETTRICENGAEDVAFLMLDIDDFKSLNDRYGHATGDDCIRQVAQCIAENLRSCDLVSRYGGEEFCVVLNGATKDCAFAVAERIRESIERLRIGEPGRPIDRTVTVSIGLALRHGDEIPEKTIGRADEALYTAKRTGKNRTVIAPVPSDGTNPSPRPGEQHRRAVA
ncbi:GGDEF domain-containing protein [Hoeflea sp.]|uniref:GGDEF domain-containing protein n=1 Tax=Hoeflea sp. TaxID=1940281 RepID=UPI003B51EFCF